MIAGWLARNCAPSESSEGAAWTAVRRRLPAAAAAVAAAAPARAGRSPILARRAKSWKMRQSFSSFRPTKAVPPSCSRRTVAASRSTSSGWRCSRGSAERHSITTSSVPSWEQSSSWRRSRWRPPARVAASQRSLPAPPCRPAAPLAARPRATLVRSPRIARDQTDERPKQRHHRRLGDRAQIGPRLRHHHRSQRRPLAAPRRVLNRSAVRRFVAEPPELRSHRQLQQGLDALERRRD